MYIIIHCTDSFCCASIYIVCAITARSTASVRSRHQTLEEELEDISPLYIQLRTDTLKVTTTKMTKSVNLHIISYANTQFWPVFV